MADRALEDCERFVRHLIRLESQAELKQSRLVAESSDLERIARDLAPLWNCSNLQVAQIRINGSRLDVRMQSDDGRAWLAVIWVSAAPSIALAELAVYERPRTFRADQPGRVVVLNGPSSVGKSSMMAAFVDAAETPWARLDEPMFGRLGTRFLAWPTTAGPVMEGFLAALAGAAGVGNQLIVSAAGMEQQPFRDALAGIATVYVGLHAPLDVLLERQRTQVDKFGGLAEESVDVHDGWVYDLSIDTVTRRPSDAARLLAEFLDSTVTRR